MARPVRSRRDDGIGGKAGRYRERSRQTQRAHVHRGGAPSHAELAGRAGGVAGWSARSFRWQGPIVDARKPSARLDHRRAWKALGLSRSVFAERFIDLLGMPPMHYLARWRMQIAASILSDAGSNIAAIAAHVGYESEAAFSRAFKKLVGVPPSEWRRRGASIPRGEAPGATFLVSGDRRGTTAATSRRNRTP